ncbi:MAG: CHASE2 domain-containing protein [Nitrospina sp.]|nr:CHASE2 domain-containing protein [Nitrospina sp.]MBT5632958.1 CHASE2 domain-containing protein [Nitrospina sp.]
MIFLTKKYSSLFCGLVVTALCLVIYNHSPSSMEPLENLFQNIHFKLRGPLSPNSDVVITEIDEKSLDTLGRWPWPRKTMAKLVKKLHEYEAEVIGFDIIFSSPQNSSDHNALRKLQNMISPTQSLEAVEYLDQLLRETNDDVQFSQALSKASKSVLGYFFHFSSDGLDHLTPTQRKLYFEDIKSSRFNGFLRSDENLQLSSLNFPTAFAVESNISSISRTASRSGYLSFDLESDGSVKKLPLIVRYVDRGKDHYFPPFSLRILEQYLQGSLLFRVNELGMEEVILDNDNPIVIPTNSKGEMEVNYLGPRGTFPGISISDLLENDLNNEIKEKVRNKIVLIGATATALEDLKPTPFDPALPGVEIHATIIDNILSHRFLTQPSWTPVVDSIYLLLIGLVLTFVYSRIQPLMSLLIWLIFACTSFYLSHWLFSNQGFWLTDVYPLMENTGIAALILLGRFVKEEKQKLFIKKVFGQYLSPRVVKELINDPSKLKLGGEQKKLTALFTDLEGFTTFSEQLSATDLVTLLNTYLSEMTDILLQYEGTLDRYDGDAIKAFFGAPVYFDDHAKRACWVCIDMQSKLKVMRVKFREEGKPELFMRVGINTGSMVIGNMGSTTRMMYGMNGDSVNLCARLEGANKQYGTYSLISEFTYQSAKEFIEVRELDTLRVVGRSNPIKIYELLGKKGDIEESLKKVLPEFNQGLSSYQNREWTEAKKHFENALKIRPEDGPSRIYSQRCEKFILEPPAQTWDGVFNLSTK